MALNSRPREIRTFRAIVFAASLVAVLAATTSAQDEPPPTQQGSGGLTPPRLSFMNGEVSFWRPGAGDWTPAAVNTALAPGDSLYAGKAANLEVQIGARAYVRAGETTQLALENHEPDFLQFKLGAGHLSLDLRGLPSGHTFELDTPQAAFTIDRLGYYRVDVDDNRTTFITRRGGGATLTPAGGEAVAVSPSEQIVIEGGGETPHIESYVAPELDAWDRWNYERTDHLIDSVSSRYVSPGVYGADALDHYGNWRVVPDYGPIWVPDHVAPGWVPYSTGRWVWDPFYGWTWVDNAPWGWAPYHYGRWVFAGGFWAWAPGPVVVRPVYAPALVAFFGGGGVGVQVGVGGPAVGWVALGWGEPLIPWWGPVGFIGHPHWAGWGGPRVVNNVVINNTTVVNVNNITYRNVGVTNAVVAVQHDRFGRGAIEPSALTKVDMHRLEPIHGELPVKPVSASLAAAEGRAIRPPENVLNRAVVATRAPRPASESLPESLRPTTAARGAAPRIVSPPQRSRTEIASPRAPFGQQSTMERARPAEAPPYPGTAARQQPVREMPRPSVNAEVPRGATRPPPPAAREARPSSASREAAGHARQLPGEPANRLFPGRAPAPPRQTAAESAPRQSGGRHNNREQRER